MIPRNTRMIVAFYKHKIISIKNMVTNAKQRLIASLKNKILFFKYNL